MAGMAHKLQPAGQAGLKYRDLVAGMKAFVEKITLCINTP